jgi:hypothetical protein
MKVTVASATVFVAIEKEPKTYTFRGEDAEAKALIVAGEMVKAGHRVLLTVMKNVTED